MPGFPERLKQARKEKKLTQQDVAEHFGMAARSYRYWESGEREPSVANLVALADLLDVSLDWLTGRTDDR